MATGYGSWVATDDWRAVVDASVSYGSDKTVATVTVVCKVQSQYGSDNGTTTGTTQCGSSSGSTSGQSIYQGSTNTLRTQTFTVTRGTSDKTVTCKGIVRCDNSTYGGATSTASVDVSIVARPTYTIAYDANSGTGAPNNGTKQYDTAYTISSTKPTRTGYNFSQWHALGSSHDAWYNSGGTIPASVNQNLTLYAGWTEKTYTVTFNANGGSGAPSAQTKRHFENLTLTSSKPTRTGYTFSKWNTKSDGSGTSYNAGASYTTNAAATLYAVWTANTYTVAFNANGGSGAPTSQTKTYGKTLTLSSTKPTRSGYTFKGWATSSSSSTVAYSPGGSYTANAAITLYAIWQINTYTVSFNANGGSGAPASQTKTHGTTLKLSTTKPTRTGYTFSGWNTKSDGSGTSYASGANYTTNAAATLYAVWQIITYTITYNANGGSNAPASQTKNYGSARALQSGTPTRTGYTFSKWNTKSDGSGTSYSPGASYTANASVTLYAIWTANTYTVSYAANGGSSTPSSQTKTYNVALTLRGAISKESTVTTYTVTYDANGGSVTTASATAKKTQPYTFSKWKAGNNTLYDAGDSYTANSATTMTAQWADGTATTTSVILPTPTRGGYTFDGWYTATSGGTKVGNAGASYTPTANITLHAQWTLSYVAPVISKLTARRCYRSDGQPDPDHSDDGGTYCTASLTWTPGSGSSETVTFTATASGTTETGTGIITSSGSTKTATCVFGGGNLSITTSYTITATISDGGTGAEKTTILSPSFFTLHFLKGGEGIGIGQRVAAGLTGLFVNMATKFFKSVTLSSPDITHGAESIANEGDSKIIFADLEGTELGRMAPMVTTNGREGVRLGASRTVNGSGVGHYLTFYIDGSGNRSVIFSEAAPWRNALGASSGIWPASLGGTGSTSFGTILTTDISTSVSVPNSSWKSLGSVTLAEGSWIVSYNVYFASNSTGRRAMLLHSTADTSSTANLRQGGVHTMAVDGSNTMLNGCRVLNLGPSSAMTWHLNVLQTSGAALNATGYIRAFRLT